MRIELGRNDRYDCIFMILSKCGVDEQYWVSDEFSSVFYGCHCCWIHAATCLWKALIPNPTSLKYLIRTHLHHFCPQHSNFLLMLNFLILNNTLQFLTFNRILSLLARPTRTQQSIIFSLQYIEIGLQLKYFLMLHIKYLMYITIFQYNFTICI